MVRSIQIQQIEIIGETTYKKENVLAYEDILTRHWNKEWLRALNEQFQWGQITLDTYNESMEMLGLPLYREPVFSIHKAKQMVRAYRTVQATCLPPIDVGIPPDYIENRPLIQETIVLRLDEAEAIHSWVVRHVKRGINNGLPFILPYVQLKELMLVCLAVQHTFTTIRDPITRNNLLASLLPARATSIFNEELYGVNYSEAVDQMVNWFQTVDWQACEKERQFYIYYGYYH